MLALGHVETIGIAGVIGQGVHIPVGVVGKGHGGHLIEGHFPIDVHRTAGQTAALVGLTGLDADVVVAVFRHLKFPFDPLTGGVPGIAADVVQNGMIHIIGFGRGRGMVIARIQGGRRTGDGLLALDGGLPGLGLGGHFHLGLRGQIALVVLPLLHGHQLDGADDHRLVDSPEGERVLALSKAELIGLGLIAHIVPAEGGLVLILFHLAGTDLVALVILADFAAIHPQAGETDGIGAGKGQHAVDEHFALNVNAAGFDGQVLHLNGIHALGRHVDLPGGHFAVSSIDLVFTGGILLQLAFTLEGRQVNLHDFGTGRNILMGPHIDLIGVVTADAAHVRRQVLACILGMVALAAAIEQNNGSHHNYHNQKADKNTPLFSHKLTTPVAFMSHPMKPKEINRNMTCPFQTDRSCQSMVAILNNYRDSWQICQGLHVYFMRIPQNPIFYFHVQFCCM